MTRMNRSLDKLLHTFLFVHHKRLPLRQRLLRRGSIHRLIFADQLNRNNLPPVEFRLVHQPLTQRRPQHFVAPGEHRKLKLKMSKPQQVDKPICLQRFDGPPFFERAGCTLEHGLQPSIHMQRLRSKHRPAVPQPEIQKRRLKVANQSPLWQISWKVEAPEPEQHGNDEQFCQHDLAF